MDYENLLKTYRKYYGLNETNYWLFINKKTGEVKFKNEDLKENNFIGFFIEDDLRLDSTLKVAFNKIKKEII